jgi:hypothetical protein
VSTPLPLILTDAGLVLGDGATPTEAFEELACTVTHLELTPETATTTVDTMCGSTDYPGTVKWSLIATLVQSFDPDATEDVLSAAVAAGGPVGFKVIPYKSQPVSATNPMWTGQVIPEAYAPISGDAGDVSTIEIDWAVVGTPTKETSGTYTPVMAMAGASSSPEPVEV